MSIVCQGNMQGDGAVPLPRAVCSFLALLRYASDGRCGERWGWVQTGIFVSR
ncbi:Uncharacterized protein EbC_pEb17201530 (plasmid) [Erwinia billingiae Eb661]|uniref:Uncharacterized protein n=1 Tax=Erwinia billingiae (strain Eb661) TaxID=634500 RepID=D8MK08_ERWBE|nr:Uncharacterized protein EbC_pEb17201530 [Erwinia billingiae Eb661]